MIKLSIVIVSHNTAKITKKCICSLLSKLTKVNFGYQLLIVDNASQDETIAELQSLQKETGYKFIIIKNKRNLGYAKANNQGLKKARGKYTLFLNSDVLMKKIDFSSLLDFLDEDPLIGALTIKLILLDGKIDLASHRGFPTLWRSFCYFSGLEKIFCPIAFFNKIFGGYHLCGRKMEEIHEIDSPSGAFFLVRTNLVKNLNGFDEDFFMYGEDLDLAWRIKKAGYKIVYYPYFEAIHLKYQSGLKGKDINKRKLIKKYFYQAMKIFYQKHYQKKYPKFINLIIQKIIDLKIKSIS